MIDGFFFVFSFFFFSNILVYINCNSVVLGMLDISLYIFALNILTEIATGGLRVILFGTLQFITWFWITE